MMSKPMSDERLAGIEEFVSIGLDRLPSNEGNANHWLWTADELLREVRRLRVETAKWKKSAFALAGDGD